MKIYRPVAYILLAVFITAGSYMFMDSILLAEPKAPHVMFGMIRDGSGDPVASGVRIEARIGNVNYAFRLYDGGLNSAMDNKTHQVVTVGSRSYNFGSSESFQVCADDPASSPIEGGQPGDVISFYIDGILATSYVDGVQTGITFNRGGALTVDLVTGTGSEVVADANTWACKTTSDPTPVPVFQGGGGGAMPVGGDVPTATPTIVQRNMLVSPTIYRGPITFGGLTPADSETDLQGSRIVCISNCIIAKIGSYQSYPGVVSNGNYAVVVGPPDQSYSGKEIIFSLDNKVYAEQRPLFNLSPSLTLKTMHLEFPNLDSVTPIASGGGGGGELIPTVTPTPVIGQFVGDSPPSLLILEGSVKINGFIPADSVVTEENGVIICKNNCIVAQAGSYKSVPGVISNGRYVVSVSIPDSSYYGKELILHFDDIEGSNEKYLLEYASSVRVVEFDVSFPFISSASLMPTPVIVPILSSVNFHSYTARMESSSFVLSAVISDQIMVGTMTDSKYELTMELDINHLKALSSSRFPVLPTLTPTPRIIASSGGGGGGGGRVVRMIPTSTRTPTATPTATPMSILTPTALEDSAIKDDFSRFLPTPIGDEDDKENKTEKGKNGVVEANMLRDSSVSVGVEILTGTDVSQAAEMVGNVESKKAAEIVGEVESKKAAEIVGNVESKKAAEIVGEVESKKAAEIVGEVESKKAAEIVGNVESTKAAEIVGNVESKKAAEVVEKVETTKAAAIVEKVETTKAAEIVGEVESKKAAEVVEKVEIKKTVAILSEVRNSKVGAILDQVTTEKVSDVVTEMKEDKLIEKLPEMGAENMFKVSPEVLLKALPNVSVEQLISEITPKMDPNTSEPTAETISENSTGYSIEKTSSRAWTKMVGSPKPIDQVMARFNEELAGVSVVVTIHRADDYIIPSSCDGFAVYSVFDINIENAKQDDIRTGHMQVYVEKEWMADNLIHKWSIQGQSLNKETGIWTEFPSKRTREDENNIYYSLGLSNFSTLAITGCRALPESKFEIFDLSMDIILDEAQNESGELNITAIAKNLTDRDATYSANLWLDNSLEISKDFLLPANEESPIGFTLSKPAGHYEIRVDRQQVTVVIPEILSTPVDQGIKEILDKEKGNEPTDQGSEDHVDDSSMGMYLILAGALLVILILAGGCVIVRRSSRRNNGGSAHG